MKILDASILIALFNEIHRPDIVDKILLLGHDLVVSSHIINDELIDNATLKATRKKVIEGKIQILDKNSIEELEEFRKRVPGIGLGECDSMLTYQKLIDEGEKAYCILDDRKARTKAAKLGIRFMGLVGLLKIMKNRNIMSSDEIEIVVRALNDSSFRFPPDVVI